MLRDKIEIEVVEGECKRRLPKSAALAFSGGGVRCAAFCHGILKFLLENHVQIEVYPFWDNVERQFVGFLEVVIQPGHLFKMFIN